VNEGVEGVPPETAPYQAVEKRDLRRWASSFVIAAYSQVRLIPQDSPALHLVVLHRPALLGFNNGLVWLRHWDRFPMNSTEESMEVQVHQSRLILVNGDITNEDTDAVVNAANSGLHGGGGVDGAIHRAGGPRIMEECRKIGSCPTGGAVITTGGNLKARHVIHAVGPIWSGGDRNEPRLLAAAYESSLKLASEHGLESVSFPSISTGAYGYPLEQAAEVALGTVVEYLKEHPEIRLVRFVLFGEETCSLYGDVLRRLL